MGKLNSKTIIFDKKHMDALETACLDLVYLDTHENISDKDLRRYKQKCLTL